MMSISSNGKHPGAVQLCGLEFDNIKAFPSLESIEVRPLTILIGRNSSGKSVISRLPLLVAQGLSAQAEAPLELVIQGVDFGRSYVDLIHDRNPHGEIGIGASFRTANGQTLKFFVRLQHFDEFKMFTIKSFIHSDGNGPEIQLEWLGHDPQGQTQRYRLTCGSIAADDCQVEFRGLWPATLQLGELLPGFEETAKRLKETGAVLGDAIDSITYLGPFRQDPERSYRYPGRTPRGVGSRGGKAPELLGDDALRDKGQILASIGKWFEDHLGGWTLDVDGQTDVFSLILRNPRNRDVAVNIVDVGAGIAQILPIVVQRYFELAWESHSAVEIIEQPELHLHPAAHGDVADLYVAAVRLPGARFLIETHSENFLLRIRRRVAEGNLSKNAVIIYWIEDTVGSDSRITAIHIDEHGGVDSWPKSVFSEDFEEIRAIRQANRR